MVRNTLQNLMYNSQKLNGLHLEIKNVPIVLVGEGLDEFLGEGIKDLFISTLMLLSWLHVTKKLPSSCELYD